MKKFYRFILFFGFDPLVFYKSITGLPWFVKDFFKIKKQVGQHSDFKFGNIFAILTDKSDNAGRLLRHYFQQDLLVAQLVCKHQPLKHVDVGSRIDGFVAHVASFRPIEVIDIRPLSSDMPNIHFVQMDLMDSIDKRFLEYTDSISCLHAIEHFGLGRYGDPIDSDGHLKGIQNLTRILKKGGRIYISTPIGKHQRIEFNAHRVFSIPYLIDLYKHDYEFEDFFLIDDEQNLTNIPDVVNHSQAADSFGCHYGCGIFILRKK